MKYNEETFKKEVELIYGNELEIISHFKGLTKPILVKDKYGVMSLKLASQILNNKPGIKAALNKTEYFMNQLREKFPETADKITPESEYKKAKEKMLFSTLFGLISISPDALLAGHCPNVRSAIDRKAYMRNQLLFLYDNKYDFIIDSDSRHKGRITLVCPIHGEQSVDSDTIFTGCGCPECNKNWEKSNVFYLVRLFDDKESFYKLGISYIKDNKVRRFREYKLLNYQIEELKIIKFDDFLKARLLETKLKRLIKPYLYTPCRWENESSTECFKTENILTTIINTINYDIVSTSGESQSSQEIDGKELTTSSEDI